jgi:hypothetical protein
VLHGRVRGDGPHVLDRFARDALADPQAHLADGVVGEADVAAHHERAPVSLHEVERADVGAQDGGDASRSLVEEGQEGHRPRREGDEVEHGVEPLVTALVHADAPMTAPGATGR